MAGRWIIFVFTSALLRFHASSGILGNGNGAGVALAQKRMSKRARQRQTALPAAHAMTGTTTRQNTRRGTWLAGLAALVLGGVTGGGTAHAQYAHQISSIVVDARTGDVLSQTNPDLRRYPASLTKLMTLYMTFSALRAGVITPDQQVPVSIHASTMEPSKLGLVPGSRLTVEEAILALVTKSANDAACALGELIGSGSEPQFALMMTRQAQALGMKDTTFRNASGLPNSEQLTTARDLATLGRRLIADFPEYYHYFSTPSFRFHQRVIPNHNPMLKVYAGAEGMKTGYTQEAGHNLVTSAMRDNVRLVGVVLGSASNSQRTQLMASQLDRGFDTEGVAPVERPLVLARASTHRSVTREHRVIAMAGATHHRALEVAEAASAHVRRGRPTVAHDHRVRLIGAKVHTISTHTHPIHHATRSRSRT